MKVKLPQSVDLSEQKKIIYEYLIKVGREENKYSEEEVLSKIICAGLKMFSYAIMNELEKENGS